MESITPGRMYVSEPQGPSSQKLARTLSGRMVSPLGAGTPTLEAGFAWHYFLRNFKQRGPPVASAGAGCQAAPLILCLCCRSPPTPEEKK